MRFLKLLWAGWKKFAHGLGVVNRYVLLTLFYFLMVNGVHVVLRILRRDLLDRRMQTVPSYWHERAQQQPKTYRHQF